MAEAPAWGGENAYELICEVGKGGMASVSLALLKGKVGFQKLVALKQLGSDLTQEPELLAMFLDEARLAARLNHPNVVQTYEVGLRNARPFIAMEFVDGQPLSRIRRLAELPLAVHLGIIADVLLGLHHAHELRDFDGAPLEVVHRDVSPQNVLVTYDGLGKLVDFGIAKAHTQLTQTLAGCVKGKLAYMSPEQLVGEPLDRRADLFSVGVLLWEACARRRLWPGISARERIRLLQAREVPSLTQIDPSLPPALDVVCRRALEFLPERRHQTAAEIEAELESSLAGTELQGTRRDVAAFMERHFKDQRAETRQLIETKLGHLSVESQPQPGPIGVQTLLLAPAERSSATATAPRVAAEPTAAPLAALLHVPMASLAPPSTEVGVESARPRNSIHSWGRSAPPPPPSVPQRRSFAAFSVAALLGTTLSLLLLGVGGAHWARMSAARPAAAAAVVSSAAPAQPRFQAAERPRAVTALYAAPPLSEPAPPHAPPPASPARKSAKPPAMAARSASSAAPARLIEVTDFGGRR